MTPCASWFPLKTIITRPGHTRWPLAYSMKPVQQQMPWRPPISIPQWNFTDHWLSGTMLVKLARQTPPAQRDPASAPTHCPLEFDLQQRAHFLGSFHWHALGCKELEAMATTSLQPCHATGAGHNVQGCRKPPFIISTAISAPAPLSSVATCPLPAHRLPMHLLPCQVTVNVNLHGK